MKKFSKIAASVTAAAVASVSFAAPADAQFRDYRHRDRGGIDAGDVIAGVAIIGGIAAIASALDRDGGRFGYGSRSRYRDDYSRAVNACGYEADRYARGRVSITDVDRSGSGYRVRGVIDSYGGFDDRFDRFDRSDRFDRFDRYDGYNARVAFTCRTDRYARIRDFDVNRNRW